MPKSALILFILGLLLEGAGFVTSNVENMPSVLSLVTPSYARAVHAYRHILRGHKLLPDQKGFDQLAEMVTTKFKDSVTGESSQLLSVLEFEYVGGWQVRNGVSTILDTSHVSAMLSNGQTASITLPGLRERIEVLRSKDLFIWAIGIFAIGIFLQIIGFIIQWRGQGVTQSVSSDVI